MRCSCGRSAGSFLQHERPLHGARNEDGIHFAGALAAFRNLHDAFAQDFDRGKDYHRDWNGVVPRQAPLSTGSGNVGLTWQRQLHDHIRIAHAMLESTQINFGTANPSLNMPIWVENQGLINVLRPMGQAGRSRASVTSPSSSTACPAVCLARTTDVDIHALAP